MKELGKFRGFKFISHKYIDCNTRYKWQCKKGHVFESSRGCMLSGQGCSFCAGRRKTVSDLEKMAAKKGGQCLSDKYLGVLTRYRWKCEKGHVWETSLTTIQRGSWCTECAGYKRRTIEEMHEIAKAKGGECLSKTFKNLDTPLKWKCKQGHTWIVPASGVVAGSWCRRCGHEKAWKTRFKNKSERRHDMG